MMQVFICYVILVFSPIHKLIKTIHLGEGYSRKEACAEAKESRGKLYSVQGGSKGVDLPITFYFFKEDCTKEEKP